MTDPSDHFDIDDEETTFAQGRVDYRTYASRSFELKRTNSADDGTSARFICKVFDPATETTIEQTVEGWVIRQTPAGRYQVKLLVAREPGNIKELWIQRVPAVGVTGSTTTLLNLQQPEISRLLDFLGVVRALPVEGDTSVRLDDRILHELLADPEALSQLYQRAPEKVRELITDDAAAQDVVALEARRRHLDRFRRLLDDEDYFQSQVPLTKGGRPEDVWQELFEAKPWMLGVSLTGQLLTTWNNHRLEQVVAGASISSVGKRVDALMRTAGRVRSMVFTEIKTHRTPLLGVESRSGCWSVSSHLAGAISQLQGTIHRAVTEIGDRLQHIDADGTDVPGDVTYVLRPRAFVVAGLLSQLQGSSGTDHQDKIRSFELFRRQLHEPEILTFDEVLARAEWSVDLAQSGS